MGTGASCTVRRCSDLARDRRQAPGGAQGRRLSPRPASARKRPARKRPGTFLGDAAPAPGDESPGYVTTPCGLPPPAPARTSTRPRAAGRGSPRCVRSPQPPPGQRLGDPQQRRQHRVEMSGGCEDDVCREHVRSDEARLRGLRPAAGGSHRMGVPWVTDPIASGILRTGRASATRVLIQPRRNHADT